MRMIVLSERNEWLRDEFKEMISTFAGQSQRLTIDEIIQHV